MSQIMSKGLMAVVVAAGLIVLGSDLAKAEEPVIRFEGLEKQMLDGAGINDGGLGFNRFNNDPIGANARPFTLKDYQHEPTFGDVKESFGTSIDSVTSFFGNLFGFMARYKLIVPAVLVLAGIGRLFRK